MNQSIAARKSETTRHDQGLICCRTCREVPWILVVWIWPRRMLRIQIFPKEIDASCAASSETCRCWTSEVSIDKHRRMTLKASCLSGKHLATRFEIEICFDDVRHASWQFSLWRKDWKTMENNCLLHSYEWPSHTMTWLHLQTWLPFQQSFNVTWNAILNELVIKKFEWSVWLKLGTTCCMVQWYYWYFLLLYHLVSQ